MFIKLDSKDIKILESNAKSETSKVALQEYLSAQGKAEVAWKVFRDSLLLSEDNVSKVGIKKERKFKAGDKVRVLDTRTPWAASFLRVGDITKVVDYKEDQERKWECKWSNPQQRPVVVEDFNSKCDGYFEEVALELVTEEEKIPNESRAEVIQRAKEFVKNAKLEEFTGRVQTGTGLPEEGQRKTLYDVYVFGSEPKKVCDVEFIVNQEKRTVVALMRGKVTKKVYSKGIAKCHPDDVFNADIGKAIALGRALGKDVSEFENAIQPTEPVVGHVVNGDEVSGFYRRDRKFTLTSKQGDTFYYAETKEYEPNESDDFIFDDQIGKIIDDTNAQYYSEAN